VWKQAQCLEAEQKPCKKYCEHASALHKNKRNAAGNSEKQGCQVDYLMANLEKFGHFVSVLAVKKTHLAIFSVCHCKMKFPFYHGLYT